MKHAVQGIGGFIALALLLTTQSTETLAQCNKDPARFGGEIKWYERSRVSSMCYYCAHEVQDFHFATLVYLPLIKPEPETKEPEAALAERWEEDSAQRTITFHLRENATWQDGRAVTARDVASTFRAVTAQNSCAREDWRTVVQGVSRVEIVDDRTVRFHFAPGSDMLLKQFFLLPILPEVAVKLGGITGTSSVCSGPWSYASSAYTIHQSSERLMAFMPNPFYLNATCPPYIERLQMLYQGNIANWVPDLQTGMVDMLVDLPVRDAAAVKSAEQDYLTGTYGYFSAVYVALNYRNSPYKSLFAKKEFRHALLHGFDRETPVKETFAGQGEVLTGPLGSKSQFYDSSDKPLAYDERTARELLAKIGLKDHDGDGVLEQERGKPIRLRLRIADSDNMKYMDVVKFFEYAMKRIGLLVEIVRTNDNSVRQAKVEGDFDLFWDEMEFSDGSTAFTMFTHPHEDNYFGYRGDLSAVNSKLAAIRSTTQFEVYRRNLQDLQRFLADDCPVLFFWDIYKMAVYHRRIKGLRESAYSIFDHIEDAYVK